MEEKRWWKEAIVYQIYPRSFCDTNGDGIGDLKGITEKMDYLSELGIDVIWLSPIYKSPNDDNGYDISDYQKIMDEFGTMEDFDELLQKAHSFQIKIMMDLVVNHTSDEHAWFVESRSSKENPYRDYYVWRDGKNGREPNNWGSYFSGSAWKFDESTNQYYLHLFSKKQPDLNWENQTVRDSIYEMMDWWCQKGIDGFRMDVINMISKVQEFPDGKIVDGIYGDQSEYVNDGPRVHEFIKEMNQKLLSKYNLLTVGETPGVNIEEAKKYAGLDAQELNMVFQFEHVDLDNGIHGKWSTQRVSLLELKKVMNKWQTGLDGCAWNSLYWNNHDQPRVVSRLGNDSEAYRELSAKMLSVCLHMMKGTPYIYQGEELGMTNAYFEDINDYRDIESINAFQELTERGLISPENMMECLKRKSRDNARTPMQWNDGYQAGFTTGIPWIKVNKNYKTINAKTQIQNPKSVFSFYKKLNSLRKQYDVIVYGTFELLDSEDENLFVYQRKLNDEKILVACNFSNSHQLFNSVNYGLFNKILISNYDLTEEGYLRPYEARVLTNEISHTSNLNSKDKKKEGE